MTVALSSRRAVLTPPWVKRPLWKAAREVPSWHIAPALIGDLTDLVAGQSLVTFTNSSPAWGFNSSGVLVQPTPNVPFVEYDPGTLSPWGWRVWDAVTNSIRNNTMAGAVAGTPGTLPTNWATVLAGVARQVVGVGTANGIDYIDIRFTGTPATTNVIEIKPDGNATIAATASQSWAVSSWIALVGGSTLNISSSRLVLNEYSAGPTYLRTTTYANNILSAGSTLTRVSGVNTTGASTTIIEPVFMFGVTSGLAVDITIRVGLPQLQQSATVGPVVKTSGLTASSTADVASITGAAFAGIWNQAAGTVYSDIRRLSAVPSGQFPRAWQAQGATTADRITFGYFVGGQLNVILASGVSQAEWYPAYFAENGVKAALAFTENSVAGASNGVLTGSDGSAIMPVVNQMFIGRDSTGSYLNGYIREVALFRSRRPNTNIQSMTQ